MNVLNFFKLIYTITKKSYLPAAETIGETGVKSDATPTPIVAALPTVLIVVLTLDIMFARDEHIYESLTVIHTTELLALISN